MHQVSNARTQTPYLRAVQQIDVKADTSRIELSHAGPASLIAGCDRRIRKASAYISWNAAGGVLQDVYGAPVSTPN